MTRLHSTTALLRATFMVHKEAKFQCCTSITTPTHTHTHKLTQHMPNFLQHSLHFISTPPPRSNTHPHLSKNLYTPWSPSVQPPSLWEKIQGNVCQKQMSQRQLLPPSCHSVEHAEIAPTLKTNKSINLFCSSTSFMCTSILQLLLIHYHVTELPCTLYLILNLSLY